MESVEKAYLQVSGIDIEEQKRIWDERGKGYYGEYLVFNHLYGDIPGMCKILMNCEIPVSDEKTTEVDLILIHETGIYSFEMKHYKGDIYVNPDSETWTQYFRTQSNEVFHNPVRQNEYHIAALKKLIPESPIFSFVVFTNDECRLRIDRNVVDHYPFPDGMLCTLSCLPYEFRAFSEQKEAVLSGDQIDSVFNALKPFSKIQNVSVSRNGEAVPILEYFSQFNQAFKDKVQDTINNYETKKQQLEEETTATIASYNRRSTFNLIVTAATVIVCLLGIVLIPRARIKKAEGEAIARVAEVEEKYQAFFAKFDDANTVVAENIVTSDLVEVTDFVIEPVIGLDDSVSVSFALTGLGGDYALGLTTSTRMIVRFSNGDVQECDFYYDSIGQPGCILRNVANLQRLEKTGSRIPITDVVVTNIQSREIEYIKLNNIAVYTLPYGIDPILNDVEIEVFHA